MPAPPTAVTPNVTLPDEEVTHPSIHKEDADFPSPFLPKPIEKSAELERDEASYILDTALKPKQRKNPQVIIFIESFIMCRSISQAGDEAGVNPKAAYLWRHNKNIANAIQKLTDLSSIKYGFDQTEIFERVKEVVTFDPIDLQRPDGTFKTNMHEIPPESRRVLKEMVVKNLYNQVEDLNGMDKQIITGQLITYKFYDKLKAAELTGREKEMFKTTNKVEHSVTGDMAQILLASVSRADKRLIDVEVAPTQVEVIDE